jgi:hypothetical protein
LHRAALLDAFGLPERSDGEIAPLLAAVLAARPSQQVEARGHCLRLGRKAGGCRVGPSWAWRTGIPPDVQRRMAQRAGATISEIAASHVSMVSKPQAAIDAILAAVAATSE